MESIDLFSVFTSALREGTLTEAQSEAYLNEVKARAPDLRTSELVLALNLIGNVDPGYLTEVSFDERLAHAAETMSKEELANAANFIAGLDLDYREFKLKAHRKYIQLAQVFKPSEIGDILNLYVGTPFGDEAFKVFENVLLDQRLKIIPAQTLSVLQAMNLHKYRGPLTEALEKAIGRSIKLVSAELLCPLINELAQLEGVRQKIFVLFNRKIKEFKDELTAEEKAFLVEVYTQMEIPSDIVRSFAEE